MENIAAHFLFFYFNHNHWGSLTKACISKMVLLRHIGRNVIRGWSWWTWYFSRNKYLVFPWYNSHPSNISIEEARNRGHKDLTLRTYVEINDLLKFRALWAERLSLLVFCHYSFLLKEKDIQTFSSEKVNFEGRKLSVFVKLILKWNWFWNNDLCRCVLF